MEKMRHHWPESFINTNAGEMKVLRGMLIDEHGLVKQDVAAIMRRASQMEGPVEPRIIEGEQVDRLVYAWQEWLDIAR